MVDSTTAPITLLNYGGDLASHREPSRKAFGDAKSSASPQMAFPLKASSGIF